MHKRHVIITHRRLQLAGHVLRVENHWIPKTAMTWAPPHAKRQQGHPGNTWKIMLIQEMQTFNITWDDAETLTVDRKL